jgi:His/Glu/Gln/Arg/opine family amino acid ABC transporter permease subunit
VSEQLLRFLPEFFFGLVTNFEIAICALAGGLLLGCPLAAVRQRGGFAASVAGGLVAFFRSAPTFVVMFFLVNVVPFDVSWGARKLAMTPWLAVVLSLTVYAAAYVSDNLLEAIRQARNGSPVAALLFLMNLVRAFFVMVLSSGFGAALGVVEATTVTLRAIENMPQVGDRLALIAVVMLLLTVCFQTIYQTMNALRRRLGNRLHAQAAVPAAKL